MWGNIVTGFGDKHVDIFGGPCSACHRNLLGGNGSGFQTFGYSMLPGSHSWIVMVPNNSTASKSCQGPTGHCSREEGLCAWVAWRCTLGKGWIRDLQTPACGCALATTSWEMSRNKKTQLKRDFPGGPVVKNPPSNAGDLGSIPVWGTKIPHATGQLSPHTSTREPVCRKLQSPRALEPACHI